MRADLDLIERLLKIAETMVESRAVQISDAALRQLKEEVRQQRMNFSDEPCLAGYEASFLVECIAELAFARSDRSPQREQRATMYINCVRPFMQGDLLATRRAFIGGGA